MNGKIRYKRFFIIGIIIILLASFAHFYFKPVTHTSSKLETKIAMANYNQEKTHIKAQKLWEVENPDNYQVTFKLQKIVDGALEDVIVDGNTVTKTLIGNGTVEIEDTQVYDDNVETTYKLVEVEGSIKKLVDGNWIPVSDGEFVSSNSNTYNKVLADYVEIGDMIAYNAASEGEYTYEATEDFTGSDSNVTYKSTDSIAWQVLNVDKSNGTVTIMAANPTDNKLSLNGVAGYKNANTILNEISAIYGYGKGAVSARSITLEDIEKYSSYNKTNYSNLNGYSYNGSKTYTSGKFIDDNGDIVNASSTSSVKVTQTAYWYLARDYVTRARAYNTLFRNIDNTDYNSYWVNAKQKYLNSGVCGYYISCINEGNVDGANLYISKGTESAKTFGVVPVVTLKSHIKTSGQDENGNWILVDDELVVNKPIISVSKNKEWVGVENPEHYKATFALYKVVKDNSSKVSTVINGEKLQLLEDKEAKTVTGNGVVSYSGLNATELVDGEYRNIEYRILEISAEYYNEDTEKWNYLNKDTDYSIKDENGTITNTVSIKTSLSVTKEWYVGIPSNYRAEYELCILSGKNDETGEEILTRADGVDHIFVRGNATESFDNLNKYDDDRNVIQYRSREVGIQKTTDGGETWETVSMDNYYTTKTEIQATTNRLSDVVSVGDYVAYDATTNGEYTYKAPYSLTGSTEQATFSSLDSMSWRVIDVDKNTGEVYLMSESPTVQEVTLSGKSGYKNERAVLDSIANVYAHGYGAVSARSITLEDIMQYSNYVASNYTNVYGYKYGNSVTYNTGRFLDENYNETIASTSNPVTVKQTAYWFVANRYFANMDIYNALFTDSNNVNNVSYWIASPAVYLNGNVAGFYSNVVNDGLIDGSILYSSEGEEYTKSMATVPVVVLSGNVNTDGQDVRGVWSISGGSVYNEQYVNQEKTEVPVEKVWNVNVLENYRATFRLKQTINGESSYVYLKDEDGNNVLDESGNPKCRTVQIVGDGEAEFTGLPGYIGTTRIQYTPEEILVETTENNGATWIEVDQSTLIMESNQDYGISTLASSVQVGDYVDYDASSGEFVSYTSDENLTGSSESSTYSSTDSVRWRVLSVDGKSVKLIADKPTETTLALSGKRGYWNAKEALNNAASVYGHGIGSVGARSITMADIEEYSTYNHENYINVHDYAYGSDVSYAEGTFLNDDGTEISASHSGEVTMKQSAYWYFTENYFSNKKAYELLFGSSENYKQYWVANTAVYLNTDTAGFYVNEIKDNTVDGAKLFSSDKHFDSHSVGIVPVVYLQANALTTGKDENGVWNLTVSDDYTDTFVNSEKTDVIANKKWLNKNSNYEYRAELTLYAPLELGLSGTNTDEVTKLGSSPAIVEIDGVEYAPVAGVNSKYVTGDETVVFDTLKKYKSTTLIDYRVIETKVEYRSLNSEEWIDLEHNGWQELTEDVDYYIDYDGEDIINDIISKVEVEVTKTWNIDNPDKYKAVIYLLRTIANTETDEEETDYVYNDDGEKMCVTIIGNSTEKFENLPSRVNRKEVTYTVSEPEFGSLLAGDLDSQSVDTSISYETDSKGNVSASVVNTWLTSIKSTKRWALPANENVNDYRATFTLFVEDEDGELTRADGIDDVVVQGNGDIQFTGLTAYNGTDRIKYVIKETKAEKYNSEDDSWTELAEGKEWTGGQRDGSLVH